MQKEGKRLAVRAGGFEAGVDTRDALLREPVKQLLEAGRSVREDFMLELATRVDETDIELQLGDVNAESRIGHGGELLFVELGGGAGQTCGYKLSSRCERLWILSDLVRCDWMPGACLTD